MTTKNDSARSFTYETYAKITYVKARTYVLKVKYASYFLIELWFVLRMDSPVVIGGAGCEHASGDSADAVSESQVSTSVVGLAYVCSGPSTHLTSTSSLPSLLTHGSDSVVR